ncbi:MULTISPECIES: hypothetical protein [unclassified Leptolyngbya]|uniref:hypothetical protein n=1 Tax=unclassified Leptolyngbya TaxID=2650499 RepID=UPI001AC6A7E3|nr:MULTISPECIES: hypothetical protein [unclassified Leptolyngbya]MBN8564433.1 hypothetical protein [Leptolyngbya sp. UWPOB_LEPTO1]MCY6488498.1 hypothetical protein [Leptolyngbya sp. GGD]
MWRKLDNIVLNIRTYADLSPDLSIRRQINQAMRTRPTRTSEDWYRSFWQPLSISQDLAIFVYQQMEAYSGLQFAKITPSDRLTEDLQLPLVCWFDWECTLCEDFHDRFGIEIRDRLDIGMLHTVRDLVIFLNQQLLSVNC